eukprot:CAMPEP_0171452744 /NCGR_PEP_ID=MMETSP0945-20130129/728_1 /TAXON_ID=109269 /ORGANISM="Vaucheria litorea, Strain CCMP2940" /LENGTH=409 /DNA_ID=CAMNT_0011977469 /DNA_START=24 /DNA_END=1250 /DNA_ORIENTATION=-
MDLKAKSSDMREKYGDDLHFLINEFSALNERLTYEYHENAAMSSVEYHNSSRKTLIRMQYFLAHVKGTIDRINGKQPRKNVPYNLHQLELLEKHIVNNILPVKENLLKQIAMMEVSRSTDGVGDEKQAEYAACEEEKMASHAQVEEGADRDNSGNLAEENDSNADISDLFTNLEFIQSNEYSPLNFNCSDEPNQIKEETVLTDNYLQNYSNDDQSKLVVLGKRSFNCDDSDSYFTRSKKPSRISLLSILTKEREVQYECSNCKDSYIATVACNPWWALVRHMCPRCNSLQTPRIDISLPVNIMDHHDQVLSSCVAESDCGGDTDGCYLSEDDDNEVDDDGSSQLDPIQAAKLLVLMGHARDCPGYHANARHAEVCQSTKFLMLHIRDCNGYAPITGGNVGEKSPCPHSW